MSKSGKHQEEHLYQWKNRAYIVWTIIGFSIIAVGLLNLAGIIWQAVATVIITLIIVFVFHNPVNLLEKRKIPRPLGTLLCLFSLVGILFVFGIAIIPTATKEISNLAAGVPEYLDRVRLFLDQITSQGAFGLNASQVQSTVDTISSTLSEQSADWVTNLAGGIFGGIMDLGTIIMIILVSLICSFWVLVDLPSIFNEIINLIPKKWEEKTVIITNVFATTLYGWLKTTLICSFITGVVTALSCWVMQVPYPALLGLVCGVLYAIPYIGAFIAGLLALLLGLIVSPFLGLVAVFVVIVIHNIVANILAPKLMKDSVNLHPAMVLIMVMVGASLGGALGMLVAIPVAAAIQGVTIALLEFRSGHKIAMEDGVLFGESKSVDTMKKEIQEVQDELNEKSKTNSP